MSEIPSRSCTAIRVLVMSVFAMAVLLLPGRGAAVEMPVSFNDVLALDARAPDRRLRYGNSTSQTAALWTPRGGGPAPTIVLLHGGCWLSEYSADYVYPLASELADDGYAVYVPEYRRVGEEGGGYPGTLADVERALFALVAESPEHFDLDRIVLMGHSAGGHLALWLAGRDRALLPRELNIHGVVGLAAITDLTRYAAGDNSCQSATEPFVGVKLEAAPELYRNLSPAQRTLSAPTALLRGAEDGIVGTDQVSAMVEKHVVLVETLSGAAHFDWAHPETAAYRLLRRTVETLLTRGADFP